VHKDVASMQKIVDAEEEILKSPDYYSEKRKEKKYDLDQNGRVPNWKTSEKACFGCRELFDLQFKQITNVPVYHADVGLGSFK
jgi:peptidyl-dipeptidase Dcp